MLPFTEILLDFVLPALIAAAGWLLGSSLGWLAARLSCGKPGAAWRDGRWVGAIAVGAAFAAAQVAIGGMPRWPPGSGDVSFRLIWFTVPVAALGVLDAMLRPPLWLRAGALFLLARLGLRALIAPLAARAGPDELWSMGTWLDGFAGATVFLWLAVEEQAERMERAVAPAVLALVAAGAAAVFGLSDSVKPSLASAALAAIAVAAVALAWPLRRLSLSRGAVPAFVAPLVGLTAVVHFYSIPQPPAVSCALLGVAPLLAWAADLPGPRRLRRGRVILRLAPVAVAAGLAVALAARQSLHTPEEQNRPAGRDEDY